LFQRFEHGVSEFREREIAKRCGLAVSSVSYALRPLKGIGAVEVHRRGFRLLDPWKTLIYWCSVRSLWRDVVYLNELDLQVREIEESLPPSSIPTAYTGFKLRFGYAPADYGEVLTYGIREEFEDRFGDERRSSRPNLIVLKMDEHLRGLGRLPLAQLYVDLWNLETWYAQEFLRRIEEYLRRTVE